MANFGKLREIGPKMDERKLSFKINQHTGTHQMCVHIKYHMAMEDFIADSKRAERLYSRSVPSIFGYLIKIAGKPLDEPVVKNQDETTHTLTQKMI